LQSPAGFLASLEFGKERPLQNLSGQGSCLLIAGEPRDQEGDATQTATETRTPLPLDD